MRILVFALLLTVVSQCVIGSSSFSLIEMKGFQWARKYARRWMSESAFTGGRFPSTSGHGSSGPSNANLGPNLRFPYRITLRLASTEDKSFPRQSRPTSDSENMSTSTIFVHEDMTVKDALQKSVQALQTHDAPEPELSACHLLSQVLSLPPSNGFSFLLEILDNDTTHQEISQRRLQCDEAEQYKSMLLRRLQHEPIQYILGEWDFYDFTLKCRAPILCPRPETEELVDWVRQDIISSMNTQRLNNNQNETEGKRIRILDVGCGTGAIGLALARLFPDAEVVAIDISPEAVKLSMENAAMLQINTGDTASITSCVKGCRYQALCCSAKDFTNQYKQATNKPQPFQFEFDFVVSNPPYIPPSDMNSLTRDVIQYESHLALCGGGNDGLDVIRDIVERLPEWTRDAAFGKGDLFMEVDTSHPVLIEQWLGSDCTDADATNSAFFVESRKDVFGKDRFVKVRAVKMSGAVP